MTRIGKTLPPSPPERAEPAKRAEPTTPAAGGRAHSPDGFAVTPPGPKSVGEAPAAFPGPGVAREQYDPNGFLQSLGLPEHLAAPGRRDREVLQAFETRTSGYQPGNQYIPGPKWLGVAMLGLYLRLSSLSPRFTEVLGELASRWIPDSQEKLPRFGELLNGTSSALSVQQRYLGPSRSAADQTTQHAFEADFHEGSIARVGADGYGTFDIARRLGFNAQVAERIARADFDLDENKSPYRDAAGKTRTTASATGGDLHWHYNRTRLGEGEDTRLTAAQVHLERAIALGRASIFDQAEVELGIGLHSLQDVFAHGQITELGHTMLDGFPDHIADHPYIAVEAEQATAGYLARYLSALGLKPPPPPALALPANAVLLPLEQALADLPPQVAELLKGAGIQVVLTDAQVRPSDLGFGADLNHDGRIDSGPGKDVDGDGVVSAYEIESHRTDGRSWNEIPAGYDASRRLIYLDHNALDAEAGSPMLRHELAHALISVLADEPRAEAAIRFSWENARNRGEIRRDGAGAHELLAERLSRLDNAGWLAAIDVLRAGRPI